MNDGAFRGTLRGVSLSFLQSSLVLWPAALLTNKYKGGMKEFIASYLAFDTLLYPLDTLKNIMYANTADPLSKSSLNCRLENCIWNFKFRKPLQRIGLETFVQCAIRRCSVFNGLRS